MMSRAIPTLTNIEHDVPVQDGAFIHNVKLGLLLALREQGLLTDQQLRLALDRLGGAV